MPLTDFFLASMAELRAACLGWNDPASDPAEPFDAGAAEHANLASLHRMDLKGLGTLEMEELVRVVLEGPEQQAANVYDTPLRPPPGTEDVIFRMPPTLIDRLARMDAAALADCLEQWSAAVGRNMGEYLAPLAELARKGVAENRQVFMWMSP